MKILNYITSVSLCLLIASQVRGQSQQAEVGQNQRPSNSAGRETLYEQDFDDLTGSLSDGNKHHGFWFEGAAGGATAQFANRRLELDANGGKVGTLWLDQVFEGDIKIEFDAQVTASKGDKSNINFFLMFSDKTEKPLYDTRLTRSDGRYPLYHGGANSDHSLVGYIITHLANGSPKNPRFRLRSTPPFDPVLHEVNGVSDVAIGKTYHIEIEKIQNRIAYIVDGKPIFEAKVDNSGSKKIPVRKRGLIGFRTWSTSLWWDNLKVTRQPDQED